LAQPSGNALSPFLTALRRTVISGRVPFRLALSVHCGSRVLPRSREILLGGDRRADDSHPGRVGRGRRDRAI